MRKVIPSFSHFLIASHRWVVERTFAWLNHHRRLSKDYEVFPKTSESFLVIPVTRLKLRRLQPLSLFKQFLIKINKFSFGFERFWFSRLDFKIFKRNCLIAFEWLIIKMIERKEGIDFISIPSSYLTSTEI